MMRFAQLSGRGLAAAAVLLLAPGIATSQWTEPPKYKVGGSGNIRVLAHIPLGGYFRVFEQDVAGVRRGKISAATSVVVCTPGVIVKR